MDTIKLNVENKPLMIAHRGCSGLEKENTNAAFVAAGNRSYWGIETDVHITLDEKVIVIHDDTTGRVAIDNMVVEESTYDTLRRLTLLNKFSDKKDRADLCLPSLEEYISICKKYEKHAVVELKKRMTEEAVHGIIDAIEEMGWLENTTFISFSYTNMVSVRSKKPNQSAQFLIKEFTDDLIDRLKAYNLDLDIYYKSLTKENIALCHENGIKVNCWTVDDPEWAEKLTAWGIDMITSNIIE